MSKAQLKKQEKAYQQAWASTNVPKDSMQLSNAVQYLQNALLAVQAETQNSQKYTLLFRYLHNAHLIKMQQSYNDLHARLSLEHLSESETNRRQTEQSKTGSTAFGEDGWQYPQLECPSTPQSVQQFNSTQKSAVEKKYQTMVKNVYFYLCYACLELNDYAGCVRNGQELLKRFAGKLTSKTEFTVKQYMAEAFCMLGNSKEAQKLLQESRSVHTTEQLCVYSTSMQQQIPDQVPLSSVVMVNIAANKLCSNDILGAKEAIDELLKALDVKLVTPSNTADSLLPLYLQHTLIYFFLKTKNFKMVRQLTKYRRFVQEKDPSEQPKSARAAPPTLLCAMKSFT